MTSLWNIFVCIGIGSTIIVSIAGLWLWLWIIPPEEGIWRKRRHG